jgi:hypothetical protein
MTVIRSSMPVYFGMYKKKSEIKEIEHFVESQIPSIALLSEASQRKILNDFLNWQKDKFPYSSSNLSDKNSLDMQMDTLAQLPKRIPGSYPISQTQKKKLDNLSGFVQWQEEHLDDHVNEFITKNPQYISGQQNQMFRLDREPLLAWVRKEIADWNKLIKHHGQMVEIQQPFSLKRMGLNILAKMMYWFAPARIKRQINNHPMTLQAKFFANRLSSK